MKYTIRFSKRTFIIHRKYGLLRLLWAALRPFSVGATKESNPTHNAPFGPENISIESQLRFLAEIKKSGSKMAPWPSQSFDLANLQMAAEILQKNPGKAAFALIRVLAAYKVWPIVSAKLHRRLNDVWLESKALAQRLPDPGSKPSTQYGLRHRHATKYAAKRMFMLRNELLEEMVLQALMAEDLPDFALKILFGASWVEGAKAYKLLNNHGVLDCHQLDSCCFVPLVIPRQFLPEVINHVTSGSRESTHVVIAPESRDEVAKHVQRHMPFNARYLYLNRRVEELRVEEARAVARATVVAWERSSRDTKYLENALKALMKLGRRVDGLHDQIFMALEAQVRQSPMGSPMVCRFVERSFCDSEALRSCIRTSKSFMKGLFRDNSSLETFRATRSGSVVAVSKYDEMNSQSPLVVGTMSGRAAGVFHGDTTKSVSVSGRKAPRVVVIPVDSRDRVVQNVDGLLYRECEYGVLKSSEMYSLGIHLISLQTPQAFSELRRLLSFTQRVFGEKNIVFARLKDEIRSHVTKNPKLIIWARHVLGELEKEIYDVIGDMEVSGAAKNDELETLTDDTLIIPYSVWLAIFPSTEEIEAQKQQKMILRAEHNIMVIISPDLRSKLIKLLPLAVLMHLYGAVSIDLLTPKERQLMVQEACKQVYNDLTAKKVVWNASDEDLPVLELFFRENMRPQAAFLVSQKLSGRSNCSNILSEAQSILRSAGLSGINYDWPQKLAEIGGLAVKLQHLPEYLRDKAIQAFHDDVYGILDPSQRSTPLLGESYIDSIGLLNALEHTEYLKYLIENLTNLYDFEICFSRAPSERIELLLDLVLSLAKEVPYKVLLFNKILERYGKRTAETPSFSVPFDCKSEEESIARKIALGGALSIEERDAWAYLDFLRIYPPKPLEKPFYALPDGGFTLLSSSRREIWTRMVRYASVHGLTTRELLIRLVSDQRLNDVQDGLLVIRHASQTISPNEELFRAFLTRLSKINLRSSQGWDASLVFFAECIWTLFGDIFRPLKYLGSAYNTSDILPHSAPNELTPDSSESSRFVLQYLETILPVAVLHAEELRVKVGLHLRQTQFSQLISAFIRVSETKPETAKYVPLFFRLKSAEEATFEDYKSMVMYCANSGNFSEAVSVFNETNLSDAAVFDAMLRVFGESRQWSHLKTLFERLFEQGGLPTALHYESVMLYLAKEGNYGAVRELWASFQKSGLVGNIGIYWALMKSAQAGGDYQAVHRFFEEAVRIWGLPIPHKEVDVSWPTVAPARSKLLNSKKNTKIDDMTGNGFAKASQDVATGDSTKDELKDVPKILENASQDTLQKVREMYAMMAQSSRHPAPLGLLHALLQHKIRPAPENFTAALQSCAASGDFQNAYQVYWLAVGSHRAVDVFFLALLRLYIHARKPRTALSIAAEPAQWGIKSLGIRSRDAYLDALFSARRFKQFYKELDLALKNPTQRTYALQMRALVRFGRIREAWRVLEKSQKDLGPALAEMWHILAAGYIRYKKANGLTRVVKEADKAKTRLRRKTRVAMLLHLGLNFAEEGLLSKVRFLYSKSGAGIAKTALDKAMAKPARSATRKAEILRASTFLAGVSREFGPAERLFDALFELLVREKRVSGVVTRQLRWYMSPVVLFKLAALVRRGRSVLDYLKEFTENGFFVSQKTLNRAVTELAMRSKKEARAKGRSAQLEEALKLGEHFLAGNREAVEQYSKGWRGWRQKGRHVVVSRSLYLTEATAGVLWQIMRGRGVVGGRRDILRRRQKNMGLLRGVIKRRRSGFGTLRTGLLGRGINNRTIIMNSGLEVRHGQGVESVLRTRTGSRRNMDSRYVLNSEIRGSKEESTKQPEEGESSTESSETADKEKTRSLNRHRVYLNTPLLKLHVISTGDPYGLDPRFVKEYLEKYPKMMYFILRWGKRYSERLRAKKVRLLKAYSRRRWRRKLEDSLYGETESSGILEEQSGMTQLLRFGARNPFNEVLRKTAQSAGGDLLDIEEARKEDDSSKKA